ncbi:uncharacterized protein LOC115676694 isoform X2 [Syzygium oleosum]|uniref:uncharacterized protein LOC115676694 isoform X2 n=1 Tax=Syzygium oleosum TaxID=219896 RepID=UPI0024BB13AC|nr:uncharacterized protein LOC115676694 isoform X2 [Syzygium oleosum]
MKSFNNWFRLIVVLQVTHHHYNLCTDRKKSRREAEHDKRLASTSHACRILFIFFHPGNKRSMSAQGNQEMGSLRMLAFALLLPLVCATNIKYCENSGDYVVKVSDVQISPNPVVPGKPTTFDISASTGLVHFKDNHGG